jgi:hypothetical protein
MLLPAPVLLVAGLKKSLVEKTLSSDDFWSCPALKVDCVLLERLLLMEGSLGVTWMVSECMVYMISSKRMMGNVREGCLGCIVKDFPKLSFYRIYEVFHDFGNKSFIQS